MRPRQRAGASTCAGKPGWTRSCVDRPLPLCARSCPLRWCRLSCRATSAAGPALAIAGESAAVSAGLFGQAIRPGYQEQAATLFRPIKCGWGRFRPHMIQPSGRRARETQAMRAAWSAPVKPRRRSTRPDAALAGRGSFPAACVAGGMRATACRLPRFRYVACGVGTSVGGLGTPNRAQARPSAEDPGGERKGATKDRAFPTT